MPNVENDDLEIPELSPNWFGLAVQLIGVPVAGGIPARLNAVSDSARRAEERRRTWTGGVARSHAEMDLLSSEFWLAMTGEERIECVFDMYDEQTRLQEPDDEAAERLQGPAAGVRSRRG
ncbi:MAG: hypothetical protein ABSF69_26550 [Polyangiaceae bacterium]|jgi:hypothetical protein